MERLRGVNFGGWLSQIDAIKEKDPNQFPGIDTHMETFIAQEDFAQISAWGFNHIRLPIDYYLFFTEDAQPIENRIKHIDRAAQFSKENSLTLLLDLHECPGHDFAETSKIPVQKLFSEKEYVNKTEKIWGHLSERYSNENHVIYEVLNEPVAPDATIWNNLKDRLCKFIRSHSKNTPIIVGSNMWSWPSTFSELTPVELDSIIYCFHFYEPLLFTHQLAPWIGESEIKTQREYPGNYGAGFIRKYGLVLSAGSWDRDRIIKEIEPVVKFRDKYDVPVICNEFGTYAPVPLKYQQLWYSDLLSVLKENDIGFSYWNYKNLDFGIISKGESLHENLPQYKNSEKINYDVLSLLREY
ncbi:cellulase family glycosylhydrolase [Chitinispirillales bacterium ANBcel5]|uniref:glycoside hydrolase family 5 protein n=1 Tax=Cellulosispirillum alkaliphilum TaxID=3039283 RepID=UPI002A52D686|nr:cellulase family glycosylhydrolase [Chitinispirillales bacterium ANBcel5]